GTYPPEAIPEFVEALESGCDVVAGSRLRGRIEDGALTSLNRLGNQALSGLAAFLFGFPISDVCTGMWAFREDCLQRFRLAAESFDLEADIFASACEVGARLRELPVDYACRIGEAKLVPLRTGLLIAWRLLMKRLNARAIVGPDPTVAGGRDVVARRNAVAAPRASRFRDLVPGPRGFVGPGAQPRRAMGDRRRGRDASHDRQGHPDVSPRRRILCPRGSGPLRLLQGGVSCDRLLRRSESISAE